MPAIVFTDSDGVRTTLQLKSRSRYTIGADTRCALRLIDSGAAPLHCEILYAHGLWQVRDLGSPVGTMVNGDWVVGEMSLVDGDMVKVGDALLVFEERAAGAPGRPASTGSRPARSARRRTRRASRGAPPVVPLVVGVAVVVVALVVVFAFSRGDRTSTTAVGRSALRDVLRDTEPAPVPVSAPAMASSRASKDVAANAKPGAASESTAPDAPVRGPAPKLTDLIREAGANLPADVPDEPADEPADGPDEPDTSTSGEAVGTLEGIAGDTDSTRSAWDALQRGVAAAVQRRASIPIDRDLTLISSAPAGAIRVPVGGARRVRIGRVVESRPRDIELADAGGRPLGVFSVLSLPNDVLAELVTDFAEPPAEGLEGLVFLLLRAEGPRRAASFAARSKALRSAVSDAIERSSSAWPDHRARLVDGARDRLDDAEGSPEAWAVLARDALAALDAVPAEDRYAAPRRRLKAIFLEARTKSIPIESLFRGEFTRLDDGRARLRYDFASGRDLLERAADLETVGTETKPARVVRGRLVLQGEYRLLGRDPFVNRLAVRGAAVPLTANAPNVNVALWTSGGDAVTCFDGETTEWVDLVRKERGKPSDYFVFGMGYRAVVCRAYEEPSEQVTRVDTLESVQLPGLVLLAGERGSPLHKDLGECLFARPMALPAPKRIAFEIAWSPPAIEWKVNGAVVKLGSPQQAERVSARPSRRGSVTIFTNGVPVALAGLEVTGELDPSWVSSTAAARAARELDELD